MDTMLFPPTLIPRDRATYVLLMLKRGAFPCGRSLQRGINPIDYAVEIARPAQHHQQVVLPIHKNVIAAVARCPKRRGRRCLVRRLPSVEPPHVAVARPHTCRLHRLRDPLFGNELLAVPLAVAQKQITKARMITRADLHAATPMTAAAH